jgi:hypothetical protein
MEFLRQAKEIEKRGFSKRPVGVCEIELIWAIENLGN